MYTLRSAFACSALLAALASAPLAAADVYLKLDTVKGESSADRSAPVEISSFSFGATNAGSAKTGSGGGTGKASMSDLSATGVVSPRDPQSGLPTGQRMHKPMATAAVADNGGAAAAGTEVVTVVLPAAESDASRTLDRACANGTHIARAELGNKAQRLSLTDVVVSSCTASASERRYEFRGHVTVLK